MADVVVTVPKNFEYFDPKSRRMLKGLEGWIAEGDAAGESWSGAEWLFSLGGYPPRIHQGERVYIVHNGRLRGYSPLVRIERWPTEDSMTGELGDLERCPPKRKVGGFDLVRRGGAVAVTIDRVIRGFQGYRYRNWEYSEERPFPGWREP